jgi:hypothetical protein
VSTGTTHGNVTIVDFTPVVGKIFRVPSLPENSVRSRIASCVAVASGHSLDTPGGLPVKLMEIFVRIVQ